MEHILLAWPDQLLAPDDAGLSDHLTTSSQRRITVATWIRLGNVVAAESLLIEYLR